MLRLTVKAFVLIVVMWSSGRIPTEWKKDGTGRGCPHAGDGVEEGPSEEGMKREKNDSLDISAVP